MADRILRWHIVGPLSETGVTAADVQGNAYLLDADYKPVKVWLRCKTGPSGDPLIVDINDDGTSMFAGYTQPMLTTVSEKVWTSIPSAVMREGSIVTMDIDQVSPTNPGKDLVVELWLDKV